MPQLLVTAVLVEGRSKSQVARQYGVSRRWVIELVKRYLAEGEAGLEPRSRRRPLRSPRRTGQAIEDEIVAIRKDLDRHGQRGRRGHDRVPPRATSRAQSGGLHHLADHGRSRVRHPATTHQRPKSSYLRFAACQPNQRWQADITHWRLADGTHVEILNLIDDHSRYCLASHTRRVFKGTDVDRCFRTTADLHGYPASLLTDNRAVFTGRSRGGGRVALEVTLHAAGTSFDHCRPYHRRPAARCVKTGTRRCTGPV